MHSLNAAEITLISGRVDRKKKEEGRFYVDPPHRQWVSEQLRARPELKLIQQSPLDEDRIEACTFGNLDDWFTRIEECIEPTK